MRQEHQNDDDKEVLFARVSCVNAPFISPQNRGKRNVEITLHNEHFLFAEDGETIGFVRILSALKNEWKDLIYVPERFVGQDLASDNLYLVKYLCPISGKTVQQEIQQLTARVPHKGVKAAGFALGHVARFFVDRLINDALDAIRTATHSGYHDVVTGDLWFDAPIKRHDLFVRTVGELRRAGLLK